MVKHLRTMAEFGNVPRPAAAATGWTLSLVLNELTLPWLVGSQCVGVPDSLQGPALPTPTNPTLHMQSLVFTPRQCFGNVFILFKFPDFFRSGFQVSKLRARLATERDNCITMIKIW